MEDKKILVVYYSRTGTTRKVAEDIKTKLNCEIDEIIDKKDRMGPIGYMLAGKDATLRDFTDIQYSINPDEYDLILIGTPVWAFTMSTAIRTYISENKDKFKEVAFFCTQSSSGSDGTFKDMQELCGKQPIALLELTTKEVMKGDFEEKTDEFIKKCR